MNDLTHVKPGSPIRTSLDQRTFSTPQSFSQNSTSFIASYCLGIHRLRFSSWPYNLNYLYFSQQLKAHAIRLYKQKIILIRLCYLNFYQIINERLDIPDNNTLATA